MVHRDFRSEVVLLRDPRKEFHMETYETYETYTLEIKAKSFSSIREALYAQREGLEYEYSIRRDTQKISSGFSCSLLHIGRTFALLVSSGQIRQINAKERKGGLPRVETTLRDNKVVSISTAHVDREILE